MKFTIFYNSQGYSLVEVLVAISILLIVITGPLTILTTTARSTSYASEQVQAFFLAQEGLELVQKMRDDRFLQHFNNPATGVTSWTLFQADVVSCLPASGPNGCRVEIQNGAPGAVSVGSCATLTNCTLKLQTTGRSRFTHTSATAFFPTYTRQVFITDVTSERAKVTSRVRWVSGNVAATQVVELDTYVYNTYALP